MSAVEMAEAILTDQKRLVPCSVLVTGEYGMKDLFIGVPVVLGGKGIERIVEMKLDQGELEALQASGRQVAEGIAELANVGV
jgi:malate dehydrogenase